MRRAVWERRLCAAAAAAWGEPAEGLRVRWWPYYAEPERDLFVVQWVVRVERWADTLGRAFTPGATRRRAAVLALAELLRQAGAPRAGVRLADEWPGLAGDERWLLRRGKPFCAVARSQGRGDLQLWEHLREPVALPEEARHG